MWNCSYRKLVPSVMVQLEFSKESSTRVGKLTRISFITIPVNSCIGSTIIRFVRYERLVPSTTMNTIMEIKQQEAITTH